MPLYWMIKWVEHSNLSFCDSDKGNYHRNKLQRVAEMANQHPVAQSQISVFLAQLVEFQGIPIKLSVYHLKSMSM